MTLNQFSSEYTVQANEQQQTAMTHVEGPALLLAVPGSGKTTVLLNRAGYLVHCCGVNPLSILTLTFTTEAAHQMKHRYIARFGGGSADGVDFSTIHSFCNSVLWHCRNRYKLDLPELAADNSFLIRTAFRDITRDYAGDGFNEDGIEDHPEQI